MRVNDLLPYSCVYLCVKEASGKVIPAGTAFVLSVAAETNPEVHHGYLVTAAHCIREAQRRYGALFMRVNQHPDDSAALIELNAAWVFHEDEANDVAVLHFPPPAPFNLYRIIAIERESVATEKVRETEAIGIGDDLVVVGLFSSHHGRTANRPIIRMGSIASMPDEPIEDPDSGLPFDAYLAEVRSVGGLSGSPVWVVIHPGRMINGKVERSRQQYYLLGLIRGHWRKDEEWLSDFGSGEQETLNTGIALVTPIEKALEIIEMDALVKERRKTTPTP